MIGADTAHVYTKCKSYFNSFAIKYYFRFGREPQILYVDFKANYLWLQIFDNYESKENPENKASFFVKRLKVSIIKSEKMLHAFILRLTSNQSNFMVTTTLNRLIRHTI